MYQSRRIALIVLLLALGALLTACAGAAGQSVAQAEASGRPAGEQKIPATQPTPASQPIAASLATTAQAAAGGGKLSPEPRTNQDGAVTVEVTPTGVKGDEVQFAVSFTTHSVDLSYDFRALGPLKDDQGNQYAAVRWDGGTGGHHLQGTLSFQSSALQPGTKWLELDLKDIGKVTNRTFRWNVNG